MRRLRPALLLAALTTAATMIAVPAASAQVPESETSTPPADQSDISSVIVYPADPSGEGPNDGSWFVYEIEPGESADGRAVIFNPADVAQKVRFAIADLAFNEGGSPDVVGGDQLDVGSWGTVSVREAVIPAQETFTVDFTIDVPLDAEPGDHIGVFMATTINQQGLFAVERRLARRLYVTVPGDVTPAWEIETVDLNPTSGLFPSTAQLLVQLRNTGRVRVEPTVMAGELLAEGSPILLAKSVEQYHAEIHVPWWGGPVNVPIEVTTVDGSVRAGSASTFIIPVGPIIVLIMVILLVVGTRLWLKRRVGRTAAMQQDIERLERMLREQAGGGGTVPAPAFDLDSADGSEASPSEANADPRAILMQAAKRARRAGDHATLASVALKLHQHDGDALELLVETAATTSGDSTPLLEAAGSYGARALASDHLASLRPEQRNLLERLVAEELLGMHSSTASATVGAATPAVSSDKVDLSAVPGLGAAKQQALLDHFGSLEALLDADADALTEVRGIGPSLASKVVDHLQASRS